MRSRVFCVALVLSLAWLIGMVPLAQAATIFPDSTDTSGNPDKTFAPEESFYLLMKVDEATDVAGVALTVEYDVSVFEVVETDQGGYFIPQEPGMFPTVYDNRPVPGIPEQAFPRMGNDKTALGKVMLSGAYVDPDPTTGGGGACTGEQIMFKVQFRVKAGAASGPYNFTLTQIELLNPDAGWGIDTDEDDIKDTPEAVPVLVGAKAQGTPEWNTPELTDDFFTIASTFADPLVLTVEDQDSDGDGLMNSVETNTGIYVDPNNTGTDPDDPDTDDDGYNDGQEIDNGTNPCEPNEPGGPGYNPETDTGTYDMSGFISYSGSQAGTLYVKVYDDAAMSNEIASTSFDSPTFAQPYNFTGLAAKATYYLKAFIDVDGGTAGEPDPNEAKGTLEVNIASDMSGSDITIEDPSIYWQTTIHADGEDLGEVYEYDAIIGVGATAVTEDAPPAPPAYTVKMETWGPNWEGPFLKDIRQEQEGQKAYRWTLAVNPHGTIPPPDDRSATISWDPASFSPEGFYRLWSGSADAPSGIVVADMRSTTQYIVTGGNADQYFTVEWSFEVMVEMTRNQGWNLISLPVIPADSSLAALFPDASVAYKFDGTYQSVTNLEAGKGYWVKLTSGGTYTIVGQSFDIYSATSSAGWHLMGAVNATGVAPITDPADAISVMYGFDGAYYSTTTLDGGNGYWVKITNACEFSIDAQ